MKYIVNNFIYESKIAGIPVTVRKIKIALFLSIIGSVAIPIVITDTIHKYAYEGSIPLTNYLVLIVSIILSLTLPLYYIFLKLKVAELKHKVDNELPYFLVLAATAESVGIPFYDYLASEQVLACFEGLKIESRKLKELLKINPNPIESLIALSTLTPSKQFSKFIQGYIRTLHEGGDMKLYYDMQISNAFQNLTRKYRQWSKLVTIMVEVFLILGFSTTIIIAIAWLLGSTLIELLYLQIYLIVPMLTLLFMILVHILKPDKSSTIAINFNKIIKTITISLIISILVYYILSNLLHVYGHIDVVASIGIGLTIFGVLNYLAIRKPYQELDENIIDFLRNLLDYTKTGRAIDISLLTAPIQTNSKLLTKALNEIIARLKHGSKLYTYAKTLSYFKIKYLTLLLDIIVLAGSLVIGVVERIIEYMDEVNRIKSEIKSNMKIYEVISIIFPAVFLLLSLILIDSLANFFESITTYGVGSLTLITAHQLNIRAIKATVMTTFTILSLCLTLMVTKAVDETLLLTHRMGLALVLNILVYVFYNSSLLTSLPDLVG